MLMRQIKNGPLDNFTYILAKGAGADCAIVDPGWELDQVMGACRRDKLHVKYILNTHSHWDHINGNAEVSGQTGAQMVIHKLGAPTLKAKCAGFDVIEIEDGDVLDVGGLKIEVIHTPGHSKCSVCYMLSGFLVTGDTLFICECGRTDLPGGSPEEQLQSFHRIRELSADLEVLTGHDYGPTRTAKLGSEKANNKFLRCDTLEELMKLKTYT